MKKYYLTIIIIIAIITQTSVFSQPTKMEINICFMEVEQSVLDSVNASWSISETSSTNHKLPNTLTLTSRFNNITNILSILEQNKYVDILSALTIKTQSGSNAIFKVVTEYTYPTSVDIKSVSVTNGENITRAVALVPCNYATRDVGVTLDVTPTYNSTKNNIKIEIMAEVVSEPIWKDYTAKLKATDGQTDTLIIQQPFFFTRSINQCITVNNDSYVIMGGMITTNKKYIKEKIPILGYIPLLGRLFQHKKEINEEWNLIISIHAKTLN